MHPTILTFSELGTDEECTVIVRKVNGQFALGISREDDGDIEVVLPPGVAASVAEALPNSGKV